MYHDDNFKIFYASYVGVAFSDHHRLVVKIKAPNNFAKLSSPKLRAFYRSKSNVIQDAKFHEALKKILSFGLQSNWRLIS